MGADLLIGLVPRSRSPGRVWQALGGLHAPGCGDEIADARRILAPRIAGLLDAARDVDAKRPDGRDRAGDVVGCEPAGQRDAALPCELDRQLPAERLAGATGLPGHVRVEQDVLAAERARVLERRGIVHA